MSSRVRTIKRAMKRNGVQHSPKGLAWLARQNGKTNSDVYKKPKMNSGDIVK